jgi:hypothetical protein
MYRRGPNKYTRNWEDEDAYGKVAGSVPVHKPNIKKSNRTGEEFPLLNTKDNVYLHIEFISKLLFIICDEKKFITDL